MTTCQSADLRVYVELRGFEPLTPSMRTERMVSQSCCCGTFLHVRDFQLGTVTASDRTLQRPRRCHSAPRIGHSFRAPHRTPRSAAGRASRYRRGRCLAGGREKRRLLPVFIPAGSGLAVGGYADSSGKIQGCWLPVQADGRSDATSTALLKMREARVSASHSSVVL
jgi:hypothetical protein